MALLLQLQMKNILLVQYILEHLFFEQEMRLTFSYT